MQGRESTMPPIDLWESFFDAAGVIATLSAGAAGGDVVEFGSGYGTFTIPMAARTSGTVYALDIDPLMVSATAERASRAGMRNIVVEQRDFIVDGTGREAQSVSFALLFNILHAEDPVSLLREAHRVLERGGRVGVTHWIHDAQTPRGPSLQIRPRPEQCRAWAEESGLSHVWRGDLPGSPWHWGMILEKS
jgi:SAM-dependent methyltransferase